MFHIDIHRLPLSDPYLKESLEAHAQSVKIVEVEVES